MSDDLLKIRGNAKLVRTILAMHTLPVGVKFIYDEMEMPKNARRLTGHRYCQSLMKARSGEHVSLDPEGISCPAAAAAFGFRALPEGLRTGKGLIGFGIVQDASVGQEMFAGMTTLTPGRLHALYLFPLESAVLQPDIVVIEDETEKLMWIALAYLNTQKGKRVESSTAILQATCVDATLIPYKDQKFNMSMGCYGCRDAADIGPHETVLGFPFFLFYDIVASLEYLNQKAIPKARGKGAHVQLQRQADMKSDAPAMA